jgi:hypothetical protein
MSEELTGTSLAILHEGFLKAKPHQALGTTDEHGTREFFGFKRRHALIKEPLSYEENKRSITIGLSVFSMNWWVYTKSSAVQELIPNHRFTRCTLV